MKVCSQNFVRCGSETVEKFSEPRNSEKNLFDSSRESAVCSSRQFSKSGTSGLRLARNALSSFSCPLLPSSGGSAEFHELPLSMRLYTSLLLPSKSLITFNEQCCNCLLYLAFNFVDFDSLRSACQISKSRQKIRGSGQTSTIKIFYKRQVGRP